MNLNEQLRRDQAGMIHEGQYKGQIQQAVLGHKQDSSLAELSIIHQSYDFLAISHDEF